MAVPFPSSLCRTADGAVVEDDPWDLWGKWKVSHVLSVLSRHSMKHKLGWHVVHLVRGSR